MSKVEDLKKAEWVGPKPFKKALKKIDMSHKKIIGLDTETNRADNKPFLLTYSVSDEDKGFALVDKDNWLDLLTNKKFRSNINFFFNMQFDIEGMLKYAGERVLKELYYSGRSEYEDCLLRYIPKKVFSIREGKHVYKYYDLWQYFHSSLEEAASRYLGWHKTGDYGASMDYDRFFQDQEYQDQVVVYAIQDAVLCRGLGEFLFSDFLKQGYSNFTSTASLSEEYFRRNGLMVYQLDEPLARVFLQAYYGGRFEVLKRGLYENVKEYDLNSAYPSIMAQMPILTENYKVKHYEGWDYPLYGCYHVVIDIPEDCYYGPLPERLKTGLVVYPVGQYDTWVTYPELNFIDQLGLDYKIVESYEIYDENATNVLAGPIRQLYDLKSKAKKEGNKALEEQAKILLNSLYGKFIQSNPLKDLKKVTDYAEIEDGQDLVEIAGTLYRAVSKKTFKLGRLFNPAYASYITATTRCRLIRSLEEKDILAFHTDSLLTFRTMDTGSDLGEWSLKSQGEAEIIKTGYYRIAGKVRSRGVRSFRIGEGFENRRIGLGQAIRRNELDRLNLILPVRVVVKNEDKKRFWYDVDDLRQDSYPFSVEELNSMAYMREARIWYRATRRPSLRQLRKEIDEAYIDSTLTDEENVRILRPTLRDMAGRL